MKQLNEEFDELAKNKKLRAVVIGAEGPVFSAGHDLRELASASDSFRHEVFTKLNTLIGKIRILPVPVIAKVVSNFVSKSILTLSLLIKVHALAAAGGCQLVGACDIVLASDHASFSTPGVTVGLFCSTPGVVVSRQVPAKIAMDMVRSLISLMFPFMAIFIVGNW